MISWSYSQYSTYKRCPQAYKFRYKERIPVPKAAASERGIAIHKSVEDYLNTGVLTGSFSSWSQKQLAFVRNERYNPEVQMSFNSSWYPVEWDAPDRWVRSVIDAHKNLGDAIHMGEWKSGKIWDDHPIQRHLYLTMALSAAPEAKVAIIKTIYLDQDHEEPQTLTREELPAAQQEWKDKVQPMLDDTFFSPRPGNYCRWCPFSRYKGGPCPVA